MATGSYRLSVGLDLKGATQSLKGFNTQLKAAQAPMRGLQNQLKQLGKNTGITAMGKGVANLAGKLETAGKHMAGLVGLSSVTGMADMIKGFADMSQQVENLSGKLGIAGNRIRTLSGMGRLTGLGDAFGSTTEAVQNVQRSYRIGTASGNQQAAITAMGLNVGMSTDQWIKTALQRTQTDMAQRGMSAATARARLGDAGVDPAMMGMIAQAQAQGKQVSQVYDDLQKRSALLLRTNEINTQAGAQLAQSFQGVGLAVRGFGDAIASRLAPVLAPMVDKFATWIATSPQANQMITDISNGIANFARWIASIDWPGVVHGATSVINALGGVKGIIIGIMGLKIAGFFIGAIGPALQFASALKTLAGAGTLVEVFGAIGTSIAAIAAPIAIAIAAVGALGVAAYELYQHWDKVKGAITSIRNTRVGRALGLATTPAASSPVNNDSAYSIAAQGGYTKQQWDAMSAGVAGIETGRRRNAYGTVGGFNNAYNGKYQMSMTAIAQAAKDLGEATPTREAFLANPALQERYFARYTMDNQKYLMGHSSTFAGMSAEQRLGILGLAHNSGAGGASKYLSTGVSSRDGFGTDPTKYITAINDQLAATKQNTQILAQATNSNSRLADANNNQAQTQARVAGTQIASATQAQDFNHTLNVNVSDDRVKARAKSGGGMNIPPPRVHQALPSTVV